MIGPAPITDFQCPHCGFSSVLVEADGEHRCFLCSRVREGSKRRPYALMAALMGEDGATST